jgi:hypothetical protein
MDKALSPFSASSAISARTPLSLFRAEGAENAESAEVVQIGSTQFLPQRGRGTACGGGARATASVVPPPLPLVATPPSLRATSPARGGI